MIGLSRRNLLGIGAGAVASGAMGFDAPAQPAQESAQEPAQEPAQEAGEAPRHGMSSFGDLKYPQGFQHFDYVDPKAPKGGVFSQIGPGTIYNQGSGTFNSLNSYILRGDAAQGMELTFASLMARSDDEPDAMYGLAASAVRISADGLTYRFSLRPEARFHDGSALTAHDVVFSLTTLKDKGHPIITQLLRDFIGCEADDDATVTVRLAPKRARDVPLFVAGLPIFSRAYYGMRPFDETTLDIPLGGGPYQVARFEAGRYIEYRRVSNWWGADLPVNRGRHNFDTVRYDYYRDREVGFEAFTAKSYLFREEFTSRIWATRYNFPAIKDGRVKRDVIPDDTPSGAQGWFINTRQAKFGNAKLREALGCAFDFEWTNKSIMYGSYDRTHSVFQNSNMMAKGSPTGEELALLEPFRGKVPDEAFGEAFVPPVSDGSGQDRALLRRASQLLQEAGYVIKDRKRVSPQGEQLGVEFLIDEPSFQAHHMPFIKNLATLGIDATLRIIDPVQMQQRLKDFDFDLSIQRFSFSATPGDSLRNYFSSQAAALKGSQNIAGIADPAVDALIDRVIAANSRAELTIACRALDRLIRAGRYWIPHWYKASHWIAYWDTFGRPPTKPRYARGVLETWWHDPHKASKIEQPG